MPLEIISSITGFAFKYSSTVIEDIISKGINDLVIQIGKKKIIPCQLVVDLMLRYIYREKSLNFVSREKDVVKFGIAMLTNISLGCITQEILEPIIMKYLLKYFLEYERIDKTLIQSYLNQNATQIGSTFSKIFATNLFLFFQKPTSVYDFVSILIGYDPNSIKIPESWKNILFPIPKHINEREPTKDEFKQNCFQDIFITGSRFRPDLIFQHLLFSVNHSFDDYVSQDDSEIVLTQNGSNKTESNGNITNIDAKNYWKKSFETMKPLIRVNVLINDLDCEEDVFYRKNNQYFLNITMENIERIIPKFKKIYKNKKASAKNQRSEKEEIYQDDGEEMDVEEDDEKPKSKEEIDDSSKPESKPNKRTFSDNDESSEKPSKKTKTSQRTKN